MASEGANARKKHLRSPDGAATEEESKRRKHSHRRHHHHHHDRHRHHRGSKNQENDNKDEIEDLVVPDPDVVAVSKGDSRPIDDDMEEGEILEEEEERVVRIGVDERKIVESDVESGEIKPDEAAADRDPGLHENKFSSFDKGLDGAALLNLNYSPDGKSEADARDGKNTNVVPDQVDTLKNSKSKHFTSSGKDYRKERSEKSAVIGSDGFGDKREMQNGDLSPRDGTESPLERREKKKLNKDAEVASERNGSSRTLSAKEGVDPRDHRKMDDYEVKMDHPIDGEVSYDELDFKSYSNGNDRSKLTSREKTRYDSDHERVVEHDRKERGGSKERVRERGRERSSSYSRYSAQDDRIDRHGKERERERKRERSSSHSRYDLLHERYDSYEKGRGRERKREHSSSHSRHSVQHAQYDSRENEEVRERKRERSSSYSRHNIPEDRNGGRDRDRERGRDREREKEKERKRESDRERDREKGRRLEGANRDKDRSGVREGDRDKRRDRNMEREIEKEGRDVHKDSRRAKQSDYYRDRTRSKEQGGISSSVNDSSEAPQKKLERDEVDIEDYEERVALKLAEQEEEDIDKIKEESRKMRQAILEKYKQNQLQKQAQQHTEGPDEVEGSVAVDKHMGQSSLKIVVSAAPEGVPTRGGSFDVSIADPSFSVGKSPLTNGSPDFERTHPAGGLGDGSPKSERAADMFSDDIFGESPAEVCKMGKGGVLIERSGLNDNWDDAEGYYSYRFGELLDGRYEVLAAHGRGVFSTVVRAKDLKAGKGDPEEVAIKIIRNNETMYKAGLDELVILKKLAAADPEDRRHCVRFLSSFKYRNHLCLVFESLHMNLREVLKKFGRNIGLKLTAVRAYAKQLFIALKHLRNCGVLHCDIKPDNMLVNEAKNVLKVCDFGNAMFAGKNEITPYLVSRFYRAPEIILGLAYDHPMDIWSVGCCLYELYSGKVLFPGPSNNDMLRLHMELKGPFPKKMLRKGAFTDQHFDQDLNFHATEEDPVTKKAMKRLLINIKPKDIGNLITGSPGEDPKMLANFKDLLEKIFVLDPEKRMTVSQALSHSFITAAQEHLTEAWMKREKDDLWVKTYPLGVSFSGMCSVSIGFFQCFVATIPCFRCLEGNPMKALYQ